MFGCELKAVDCTAGAPICDREASAPKTKTAIPNDAAGSAEAWADDATDWVEEAEAVAQCRAAATRQAAIACLFAKRMRKLSVRGLRLSVCAQGAATAAIRVAHTSPA